MFKQIARKQRGSHGVVRRKPALRIKKRPSEPLLQQFAQQCAARNSTREQRRPATRLGKGVGQQLAKRARHAIIKRIRNRAFIRSALDQPLALRLLPGERAVEPFHAGWQLDRVVGRLSCQRFERNPARKRQPEANANAIDKLPRVEIVAATDAVN